MQQTALFDNRQIEESPRLLQVEAEDALYQGMSDAEYKKLWETEAARTDCYFNWVSVATVNDDIQF